MKHAISQIQVKQYIFKMSITVCSQKLKSNNLKCI